VGECYGYVEAAVVASARGDRGAVRVGDGPDDRQAEAVPFWVVGALAVQPLERLEQAADFLRGYPLSGVADGNDGAAVAGRGR
jgi:hypothetical protein